MVLTKDGKTFMVYGTVKGGEEEYAATQRTFRPGKGLPPCLILDWNNAEAEAIKDAESLVQSAIGHGWTPSSLGVMRASLGTGPGFDPYAGMNPLPSDCAKVIRAERKAASLRSALEERRRIAEAEAEAIEAESRKKRTLSILAEDEARRIEATRKLKEERIVRDILEDAAPISDPKPATPPAPDGVDEGIYKRFTNLELD